jgi:hypothetical protein
LKYFVFSVERQLSGAGESHPYALPEPDVSLSAHPAPIDQPSVSHRSSVRTSAANANAVAPTKSMLVSCVRVAVSAFASPNSQYASLLCTGLVATLIDGTGHNIAPIFLSACSDVWIALQDYTC